ncbi:hypothetical protein PVMG_02996 [Plasmodium vivax Mauritania I]|uniref:NBD94 domain-containing protein n=1 Tax=Plasmodium vivax Mauritania I TaxID=1035515 RepID=A0A0J9TFB7_PLAVI|nr:hypothetical protein PVMG_02996 [Plasmodium vivax Mauritania I]
MIKIREINVKEYDVRSITSYFNATKKIHRSGEDTIKRVKKQLNNSLASETVEFILEEIKYITEKMSQHLEKVKQETETINKLSKQEVWSHFFRFNLQRELFFLAYSYSSFKFSTDNLRVLKNVSESKTGKLYQYFAKFEGSLNHIINTLMSSKYSTSSINSVLSDSEEILKSVETLRSSTSEQIKEHVLYSNAQIEEAKKILDEKMLKLEEYAQETKGVIKTVNETFKLNIIASEEIEKKRRETNKNKTSLEKCKIFVEVIDLIKSNKYKATQNNKKIEELSKQIITIKSNFQQSETAINEDVQKIKELIENEKKRRSMKDEIKKHLKYFPETVDNIKKIISQREEIEKYILSIENLIKDAPSAVDEFTTEKTELQDKAKSIVDSFYKENLQTFVDDLAEFYTKHQALDKEENTKEETEALYEKTKEKYQQLVDMKCDGIPEMLNNLSEVLNSLTQLKNKIIEGNIQNIKKDVSSSLKNLTEETDRLKNSLKDYEQSADKLKTYINSINGIKDKVRTTLIEKDEDIPELKTTYEEYTKQKGEVTNKESTVTHDIDETKTLLEGFNTKIESLEFEKLQDELRSHKESASSTINQIENTKKVIDTLKSLNTLTKNSNTNEQSIAKIKERKNDLVKKIDKHIEALNSYNIVEDKERTSLLNTLNEEKNNVESEIPETSISKLQVDVKASQDYCKNEKINIDKGMETNSEELGKYKTECHNTELEINKLNANYQALEKKIEELVQDQHGQIIIFVDKLITTRDTQINGKIELNLNSLKDMKTKLDAFNFEEAVNNNGNVTVQSKISAFKEKVKSTLQNIENEIGKFNGIKQNYDAYMETFNKGKDQITEFKDKKENMEKIYKQMKETTLNKLEEAEKESSILNQVKQIELEYRRILIHHAVHMIDQENTKAKSVMADIETSKSKIDEIKLQTEEYKQKNMTNFEYENHYSKAKQSNTKINEFSIDATSDKEKADKSEDVNEIERIKEKINDNLQKVKEEYTSMEEIKKQMNSMKDLLALNNSETTATNILDNTKNALGFSEEAAKELEKSKQLLEEAVAQIAKAGEHKGKIEIALEDEQINAHVNQIELIKNEIVNKKKEMESYLSKIKEYKEKCTTQVNNSNRGKDKIEFLKTVKHSVESSSNKVDMDQINESIEKSEQYLKDVEALETQADNNLKSYIQHEQTINDTFQQSEILGIETKSKKKFNEATAIMEEIKKQNSEIQTKVNDFQVKLNKLKEPQNAEDVEEELNNEKSSNAKALIHTNLERVQSNLTQVANIKQEVDGIFKRVTDTMNSATETSQNKDGKTLGTVKRDEPKYEEYLTQITADKNLMDAELNKLNGISSTIEILEKELNESRMNYEIGLLQKIDEVGKSKKTNIDLKKELISSTLNSFSSLFNGLDLNQYEFKKNIDGYEQKMKEIQGKFDVSLNKIGEHLKKASEEGANYTLANKLRREAQQEKAKLTSSEDEASKYIEDIKKVESIRFINHMKENLDKISTSIKEEKLKINEGHEFIKQIVEGIKNTDDERDVSNKLQQAKEKMKKCRK